MKFEAFLETHFRQRLKNSRILVIHDPDSRYADVTAGLAGDGTVVLDCGADIMESRERAFEELNRVGEDQSGKSALVLFIPRKQPLEDHELLADPFQPFALSGLKFPDGAGDSYRALCLQFLPEQAGKIEELFADGDAPSFGIINGLRSGGAESVVLQILLQAEGPREIMLKFLGADELLLKKLRNSSHWIKDFKDLVAKILGLHLDGQKGEADYLQATLWRYLLFSEFASDLPAALPAGLSTVPHAVKAYQPFVKSLCHALRDNMGSQAAYEEAAERISKELGLESACAGIEDFGELDTFSFEERSFLRRFSGLVKDGKFEDAKVIANKRQSSFWTQRDAARAAEWRLGELALRLLINVGDVTPLLAQKRKLDDWIEVYASMFTKIDTLHRSMEHVSAEIAPVEGPLKSVLNKARDAYSSAADKLARHFQDAVTSEGWPAQGYGRATDIFEHVVEPLWKAGKRVAYFWIDALRHDLAMPLEAALSVRHKASSRIMCGQLPGVTVVGMAALLPGASKSFEVIESLGKVVPVVAGVQLDNAKARGDALCKYIGVDRCRVIDLENAAAGKLGPNPETIRFLAVKSTDIDSLGENNPSYFLRLLPDILRKIQTAVNRLADEGFDYAVIATDHGFCWMPSSSAGNAVSKPSGQWPMSKDRCLLGAGAGDASSFFAESRAVGIRSELPTFATPRGLATYTTGVTYFHGGISPQENLLPVIEVELKPAIQSKGADKAHLTLTYRGAATGTITALVPSLELSYPAADFFGPSSVRLLLQGFDKKGVVVASPAASALVDPTTGEICLERGKAVKIPVRVQEDFTGDLTIEAKDAITGWKYASVKLVTEFHH
ncbi:MAG: PglZ protein [Chthoniobacteraceae bacterium]|nr:PglZ protein [Chthoniobacteraceae bacterium]